MTYAGWKNYPTWAVNIWFDNDQATQEMVMSVVGDSIMRSAVCEPVEAGIWTPEQAARCTVADDLKAMVNDEECGFLPDLGGMAGDLLAWAVEQVNWDEIADSWISRSANQDI